LQTPEKIDRRPPQDNFFTSTHKGIADVLKAWADS
jgi:hypothetical protein